MAKDKPFGEEQKRGEDHLAMFQSLKKHPAYDVLMGWVDERTRGMFNHLLTEKDPTQLAKDVGAVAALREVRARVDSEIDATLKYLAGNVEE